MEKIIHYCWFGGKKLPSKVKKCISTWKKYLPDYEIKEWNEKNFNINTCSFVKEAYENKKWAFVSDYVRIYALYNEGGIYFDTDMKIIKDVSNIVNKEMFLGYEDSGYVGTAVIGVKEKNNKYIKEILDYYNNLEHFYVQSIYSYANPVIITKMLNKYSSTVSDNRITIFDNNVYVYPRDYFYPLSYNYDEKIFTNNTCMVHLFRGTWTSRGERRTNFINRLFGMKLGMCINKGINGLGNFKRGIIHISRENLNSLELFYSIHFHRTRRLEKIKKTLHSQKDYYLAICHPEWIGVKNATKDSFGDNFLEIREQYNNKEATMIAKEIVSVGKKLVIFNSFAKGWEKIIISLKKINPDIKIKLLIHSSNALLSEPYDWEQFNLMLDLYEKGKIDEIGFVKKSLYEFYKAKGFRVSFLMNDVNILDKEKYINEKIADNDIIRVGLYASDDRWVKNIYNQLSAISLIPNVKLDCVPINYKIVNIARRYNINLTGKTHNVSREDMYKRMAKNDITMYVSFTECAPLIPLESLELGTICITGDNHHYFTGTELEKYLVVSKEDDIMEIYHKMLYALENREKILQLYKDWKIHYSEEAKKSLNNFLKL